MNTTRSFLRSILLPLGFLSVVTILAIADSPNASAEQESDLLAVLRSDAPAAEKAIVCKKLAIFGSDASLADLSKLLSDPQLSSWARIPLEVIPGEAADEVLRQASTSLDGRLLVGTINSIGVRRDAAAVDLLAARLQDTDSEVASAAAIALGRIGNTAATQSLRQALATSSGSVRDAVAQGCILCAEHLLGEDKSGDAAQLYDEIRQSDVAAQRVIEATRGAILAREHEGVPLLVETLRSPEKKMFQLGLGTARELAGDEVDRALASELKTAAPERAAMIIQAMADRPETVDLAAVMQAAEKGDKQVRISGIDALQRIGDVSSLSTLLTIAVEDDADLAAAATETLAALPSGKVDEKIVSLLPDASGDSYPLLIELVGKRRIDAVPELVRAISSSDQSVRHAALVALGETVSLDKLALLISQVVTPDHAEDAAVATEALRAASIRMPDRESCASQLAAAMQGASSATQSSLLEILGEMGGQRALETLASAAKSNDPELQDTASRVLGKWNGVDAAPVLLDLATTAPGEKYQIRALRGYISLARRFAMPEPQRVKMCGQAMEVASRSDERKLVLDVLTIHPSIPALKLAVEAQQDAGLKSDATAAAKAIAQKLRQKGIDVSGLINP